MTSDQRIDDLEKAVEDLRASLFYLRSKFTPSGYMDIRYVPQLSGDVTHAAGTEDVAVDDGVSVQKINVYDENNTLIGTRPGIKIKTAAVADNAGLDAVDLQSHVKVYDENDTLIGTRTGIKVKTAAVTDNAGLDAVDLQSHVKVYNENDTLIGTRTGLKITGAALVDNPGLDAVDAEVTLDRFEYQDPVGATTILELDTAGTTTATVLNVTETGRLIGIGVVVSKYTATNGTSNAWLDITIDGGTKRSVQFVFADRKWGKSIQPLVRVGATPVSGDVDGHAFYLDANLTYKTSLLVELRKSLVTSFTGEYDVAAIVYRGKLT